MKTIIIKSNKYGRKKILISDQDFEKVKAKNWFIIKSKRTFYAVCHIRINKKQGNLLLHRFILNVVNPEIKIDHVDHNGLNCQRANMRECNHLQNRYNRLASAKSTSIFLGVSKGVRDNLFRASISVDGKNKYLGYFKTEQEAAWAYDFCAMELREGFANLNFKY